MGRRWNAVLRPEIPRDEVTVAGSAHVAGPRGAERVDGDAGSLGVVDTGSRRDGVGHPTLCQRGV
jgi:hypothetical protein